MYCLLMLYGLLFALIFISILLSNSLLNLKNLIMIISENVLLANGADYVSYEANQTIFNVGAVPKFYFQIADGSVELNNYHEDGKKFTQNILSAGQSIGEFLLFNDKPSPIQAVARTKCLIMRLSKEIFFNLIHQYPDVSAEMFRHLADKLYYKYIMLFNNSSSDPFVKIRVLMDYFKDHFKDHSIYNGKFSFEIPFTRQQLANLTGLRVETVIRAVKKMENESLVKIKNRKIYY
jgi:CRP-like cAMP-binding protein